MGERKLGRATRDAYGDALVELANTRDDVVVFDADLAKSTRTGKFGALRPERFFDAGICEANMVGTAAGVAACGKTVFVSTFSAFLMCKAFDQLRMAVAYPRENVKMVTTHGGITLGQDGASQMSVEDFALALGLPGVTVIHPADDPSAKQLILQAAATDGPVYFRLGREKAPLVYEADHEVRIGRAEVLSDGRDVTLVANGMLLAASLDAAEQLAGEGVEARVIDVHTLRPIDRETLGAAATETGAMVVAEEHLTVAGLGSVVAQTVAETCPVPMEFVGLHETYAESGQPAELLRKYGLTADDVLAAARRVLARKG
ncbi:MAG: transketolase family protein [Armatimonadetes bacterium]|nr:transketolase family protein [Armatimonadota bacterium]